MLTSKDYDLSAMHDDVELLLTISMYAAFMV